MQFSRTCRIDYSSAEWVVKSAARCRQVQEAVRVSWGSAEVREQKQVQQCCYEGELHHRHGCVRGDREGLCGYGDAGGRDDGWVVVDLEKKGGGRIAEVREADTTKTSVPSRSVGSINDASGGIDSREWSYTKVETSPWGKTNERADIL